MKIVGLPDLHSYARGLSRLADAIRDVDVVLLVGDLTNGSLKDAQEIITMLRELSAPGILAVPGNMDTIPINDYLVQEGVGIHGTHRVIDGVAFVGLGGALPFAGRFVFDEDGLGALLDQATQKLDAAIPQILVCHQPPYNTANDLLSSGTHVGSTAVRDFIQQHQPLICFTGHIHEAVGMDSLGTTRLINSGSLRGGTYAYAEVIAGKVTTLEICAV